MKRNTWKKIVCIMLAFVMTCTTLSVQPISAKAEDSYINILHKVSTAEGNVPIKYNFSLSKNSDIFFVIRTNERTGVTINIKEPGHDIPKATVTLAETNPDWQYDRNNGIYQNTAGIKLDAGEYILELQFDIGVNFDLSMNQISPNAKLNKSKVSITKGFTTQLKVNGGTIRSCSSKNKSIATVTSKGKITAKNYGTTKISVHLTNGKTLTCNVTVKENKYTGKKISISDTLYNTYDMKAYHASFDSKGNLVVKFIVANNSYGQLKSIPNFSIVVKDSKKAVVASYKKSSYSVNVKSYSDKSYSVTIPKSALKKNRNKIDLRTSAIKISGNNANSTL